MAGRRIYSAPGSTRVEVKATHIPEKMFDIFGLERGGEPNSAKRGFGGGAGTRWALGAKAHKRGNRTMQPQGPRVAAAGATFGRSHTLNQASRFEGSALRGPTAVWLRVSRAVARDALDGRDNVR